MTKRQKNNLIRILVTAALMILIACLPVHGILRFVLYLLPYLLIGYDILIKAWKGIRNRQPFDESLLMSIATIGALVLAVYKDDDYIEAIAVMLFYQVGEWFQSYAVGKSRRSISDLMDIRPDYANMEDETGALVQVDPDEVEVGSVIVVQPGEKIPIDGVVASGTSSLDTSALTGESVPRDVKAGDEVISGCINQSGVLRIETTREFDESTASKILELIEDAGSRKSKSENFITKFARVYTPVVVWCALALAFLPPLVRMLFLQSAPMWGTWVYRALTFLVVSCPCALVISIPLSFFAGIGGASRAGVLIKGSNYLELLSQVRIVAFDKTGTLTKGVFEVTAVHPKENEAFAAMQGDEDYETKLLHLAAHVERHSSHPIAQSLKRAYPNEHDDCVIEDVTERAGEGIEARVNGDLVSVGNSRLMERVGAQWHECHRMGTVIHVAINGSYAGHIVISDQEKPTAKEAMAALQKAGVKKTVMLTGDTEKIASRVAQELGIDAYHAQLLPADKVRLVEQYMEQKSQKEKLAFVGDGINDAPVLSRADIGIAMGAMGSDAAIEAADIVLMDDDPLKISLAIRISTKCMRIVNENIYFAIGVKLLCLLLVALGFANMWAAIFADVGVMILAVLNAIRAMFIRRGNP